MLGMMTVRLLLVAVRMEMFKMVNFTLPKYISGYFFVLITFVLNIIITFKGSSKEGDIDELYVSFNSSLRTPYMYTDETEFPNINFVTLPDIRQMLFSSFFFLANFILLKLLHGLAVLDAKN
jgi:hypothetical protein